MMSIAYDYSREAMPAVSSTKTKLLLIDGQHVPSVSGRFFETLNPATEQPVTTVAGTSVESSTSSPTIVQWRHTDFRAR